MDHAHAGLQGGPALDHDVPVRGGGQRIAGGNSALGAGQGSRGPGVEVDHLEGAVRPRHHEPAAVAQELGAIDGGRAGEAAPHEPVVGVEDRGAPVGGPADDQRRRRVDGVPAFEALGEPHDAGRAVDLRVEVAPLPLAQRGRRAAERRVGAEAVARGERLGRDAQLGPIGLAPHLVRLAVGPAPLRVGLEREP